MRTIKIKVDRSCEMASVSLDGECIMEGNYWDFHPGCHGIEEYGDFKGYLGLANAINLKLIKEGTEEIEFIKENYTYE